MTIEQVTQLREVDRELGESQYILQYLGCKEVAELVNEARCKLQSRMNDVEWPSDPDA